MYPDRLYRVVLASFLRSTQKECELIEFSGSVSFTQCEFFHESMYCDCGLRCGIVKFTLQRKSLL